MVQNAFARPSNSPWSSPIVLVKKKDKSTRFCVDHRRVNEITRKDAYPIPRIEETLLLLKFISRSKILFLCRFGQRLLAGGVGGGGQRKNTRESISLFCNTVVFFAFGQSPTGVRYHSLLSVLTLRKNCSNKINITKV